MLRVSLLLALLASACGGDTADEPMLAPDARVVIVDAEQVSTSTETICSCDPLAQTGCNAGEHCTWIWDSLDNSSTTSVEPDIGHIACALDSTGTVAPGGACTRSGPSYPGDPGTGIYAGDTCARGAYCSAGTCKLVCDQAGGAPACAAPDVCTVVPHAFTSAGIPIAGVCEPGPTAPAHRPANE